MSSDNQLEMNLSLGENQLKRNLNSGVFTLFIEHSAPSSDIAPEAVSSQLNLLDQTVADIKELPMALAITDQYTLLHTHRAIEYATSLPPERRNAHLVYLSGRDTQYEQAVELLQTARNAGITNVIPVSGDLTDAYKSVKYSEDINILHKINQSYPHDFYSGAVVNPFKYRADVQFGQIFKLIKKFNNGAQFVVTQAGWDMQKLQSLKWYLAYRGMSFPTVARLMFLTPSRFEKICANQLPGITVSPDFKAILQRELAFSDRQFESAQWRRLELQVAGCRLLGYTGVQIAGVDTPEQIKMVATRVKNALREFGSFEHWVEEYQSYQAKAEMAPTPDSFIMFNDLLKHQYYDSSVTFRRHKDGFCQLKNHTKLLYHLRKELFLGSHNSNNARHLLKKVMLGCRSCERCYLPESEFICLRHCPKRLLNGPCGNADLNGRCELGDRVCVFTQQLALANWRGELDLLEDRYIPHPQEDCNIEK